MAGCVYAARLAGDDPITAQPDYYTVAEVAEKLRIDIRTVYELIASGQLRSVRITRASGRRGTIRIPQDYLDEYIGRIRQ